MSAWLDQQRAAADGVSREDMNCLSNLIPKRKTGKLRVIYNVFFKNTFEKLGNMRSQPCLYW